MSLLAVSILSLTAVCLMKLDTESFEQSFEQQPGFSVPLKFSICNTNPRKDRPQPVLAFAEYNTLNIIRSEFSLKVKIHLKVKVEDYCI